MISHWTEYKFRGGFESISKELTEVKDDTPYMQFLIKRLFDKLDYETVVPFDFAVEADIVLNQSGSEYDKFMHCFQLCAQAEQYAHNSLGIYES